MKKTKLNQYGTYQIIFQKETVAVISGLQYYKPQNRVWLCSVFLANTVIGISRYFGCSTGRHYFVKERARWGPSDQPLFREIAGTMGSQISFGCSTGHYFVKERGRWGPSYRYKQIIHCWTSISLANKHDSSTLSQLLRAHGFLATSFMEEPRVNIFFGKSRWDRPLQGALRDFSDITQFTFKSNAPRTFAWAICSLSPGRNVH